MPIGDGKLLEAISKRIENRLTDSDVPVSNANAETVADQVAEVVTPIVQNAGNREPLFQSRVFLGSLVGVLSALGVLADQWAKVSNGNGFDPEPTSLAITTLLGAAFAIYGRVKKGLGPFRWFGLIKR